MQENLKSFGDFLLERSIDQNTLVFAFGRFQPPTIGHELLIEAVVKCAQQHNALPHVFVSKKQDSTKNPLSSTERCYFLSKMFPNVRFNQAPEGVDALGRKVSGIMGILQAYDQRAHNVIILCGSDRLEEFQKKCNAQNGKLYHFYNISVVSIGDRDPDAEDGLESVSGTKMRAAAHSMDFESFHAGLPQSLSKDDAHELMFLMRKAMSVRESFNLDTPSTFADSKKKAVFLLGVPGSGKDFVLEKALSQHSLLEVNSSKPAPNGAIASGTGVVFNVNADDYENIAKSKKVLEDRGYKCKAIFVSTSNNVSKKRNLEREARGGRVTPEHVREAKWQKSVSNKDRFIELFGASNFLEFDNSIDLRLASELTRKRKAKELLHIFNEIRTFVGGTISDDINVLFEHELLNESKDNNNKKLVADYLKKKTNERRRRTPTTTS